MTDMLGTIATIATVIPVGTTMPAIAMPVLITTGIGTLAATMTTATAIATPARITMLEIVTLGRITAIATAMLVGTTMIGSGNVTRMIATATLAVTSWRTSIITS